MALFRQMTRLYLRLIQNYRNISKVRRTLVGNKIVDH